MGVSRSVFRVAVYATTLAVALPAFAEQQVWGWFRASSTGSDWWLTQGKARVTFTGSSFSAELRDGGPDPFVRVLLEGTVRDREVVAKATVQHTDKPDATLAGRLRRLCWQSGGGRELLVLTDGVEVISLVRELPSGQPCEPAA